MDAAEAPLLMHSTWSPGCAADATRATSASTLSQTTACSPIGASTCRWVPGQAAGVAEREVGFFQRPGQLRLHRAELHRVRAWLEDRQDALVADPCAAGRRSSCASPSGGGRSRREPSRRRPRRAARGGGGRGESPPVRARRLGRHAGVLGRCDRGQRIELVVFAEQRPLDATFRLPRSVVEGVRLAAGAQRPGSSLRVPKRYDLAPAAQARMRCRLSSRALTTSRPRPGTVRTRWWNWRSMAARSSNVGDGRTPGCSGSPCADGSGRTLLRLSKKAVVLVGLDDEWRARLPAAPRRRSSSARRRPEPRPESGLLEDQASIAVVVVLPCVPATASTCRPRQDVLGEPLRPAGVGAPASRIASSSSLPQRDDVADHEQVRRQVHLRCAVTFDQLDLHRPQLLAHRRIDLGVAPGHTVPGLPRQRGLAPMKVP